MHQQIPYEPYGYEAYIPYYPRPYLAVAPAPVMVEMEMPQSEPMIYHEEPRQPQPLSPNRRTRSLSPTRQSYIRHTFGRLDDISFRREFHNDEVSIEEFNRACVLRKPVDISSSHHFQPSQKQQEEEEHEEEKQGEELVEGVDEESVNVDVETAEDGGQSGAKIPEEGEAVSVERVREGVPQESEAATTAEVEMSCTKVRLEFPQGYRGRGQYRGGGFYRGRGRRGSYNQSYYGSRRKDSRPYYRKPETREVWERKPKATVPTDGSS